MYDAPVVEKMVAKVKAKIGNITCVLKKLNYVSKGNRTSKCSVC